MRALDDADDRLWELLHPDIYNQVKVSLPATYIAPQISGRSFGLWLRWIRGVCRSSGGTHFLFEGRDRYSTHRLEHCCLRS